MLPAPRPIPTATLPPAWRRLDLACLVLASVLAAALFLRLHAEIAPSAAPDMAFLRDPNAVPTPAMGWWAWWDQGFYQRAAVSWASGVTDPVFHWYLPGYPLLAAAFVHVTPADPFLLPNLACLVGTLWLFCGVASRLLGGVPFRVPVACALFVASSVVAPRTLWAWVVPWTTTPEALCIFGALLGAMRLVEGGRRRDAFLTGLATAAIAGFRPADAAMAGLAILVTAGPALLRQPRRLPGLLAAVAGGALLPVLVVGGAYLLTWGTRVSGYVALSGRIGFEPRLLALRWVTLMIDPRPLFPDGRGLAEVFTWIVPGVMGMAATLVAVRRAASLPHRLVIALVAGDIAMFLTYRDLHPTGLWHYGNYHYFKWTLPVFALYAFRLVPMALGRDGRRPLAAAAACLVVPALFCWRPGSAPNEAVPPPTEALMADKDGPAVTVTSGLNPVDAMILVPGHGPGAPDIIGGTAVTASQAVLRYGIDFVIYGARDVMRVVPLRPLPQEATTFRFAEGTYVDRGLAPSIAWQTITWGLPFRFLGRSRRQEISALR